MRLASLRPGCLQANPGRALWQEPPAAGRLRVAAMVGLSDVTDVRPDHRLGGRI